MLLAQKQYKEAADQYLMALKIDPTNETALTMLAKIAGVRNKRTEVIIYLKKLLEVKPNDVSLYYNIAFVYASMGQHDESQRYISLGREKSGDDGDWKVSLPSLKAKLI